jgi:hypothetical protein
MIYNNNRKINISNGRRRLKAVSHDKLIMGRGRVMQPQERLTQSTKLNPRDIPSTG